MTRLRTLPGPLVTLIGGNSGTGKTTTAREIARASDAALQLIDDLRLFAQRLTAANSHPALHRFDNPGYLSELSPEEICAGLIALTEVLSPGIEMVVAHHLHVELPIVIEGDGLSPRLASQRSFASRDRDDRVAAVFILELDERVLLRDLTARGRGFASWPPNLQERFVRASSLYGAWIREEARALGLPTVSAQPRASLRERVVDAALHPQGVGRV